MVHMGTSEENFVELVFYVGSRNHTQTVRCVALGGKHLLPTVPFYWRTMVFNTGRNDIILSTSLLRTLEHRGHWGCRQAYQVDWHSLFRCCVGIWLVLLYQACTQFFQELPRYKKCTVRTEALLYGGHKYPASVCNHLKSTAKVASLPFFSFSFVFFQTGFYYVALAGLELKRSNGLCLLHAGIKGVHTT